MSFAYGHPEFYCDVIGCTTKSVKQKQYGLVIYMNGQF